MDAAALSAEHHVLDVGCGNGQTTRDAARAAAAGSALGIDLSTAMVERARERARAEGLANVRFEPGDAQIFPFDEQAFDRAISRAGAMFFGDPVAAFSNIARALRPDGRLVLFVWQELAANEWVRCFAQALAAGRSLPQPPPGAPGPFSLADPDRVRTILGQASFTDVSLEAVGEPMYFGADAEDSFGFVSQMGFARGLLQDLDDAGREQALASLRATIAAHDTGEGVLFDSAAWLVTARRR